MPPTVKDGSGLATSIDKMERAPEYAGGGDGISTAQPVALEVPVTVNGARAVEGSEKREPFSETTTTVLVLANGAVIRLLSSVAPGQLLFLTNEKTRKEVVCQVVKSKNYRSVTGYVELEFTEPVLGFWGMRFPADRQMISQSGSGAMAERKPDAGGWKGGESGEKNGEAKISSYADAGAASERVTTNLADVVEEFKTEIKADSRATSRADFLAPAESSLEAAKPEGNRLQEQLSALLHAEQKENEEKPAGSVVPPTKRELADAAVKMAEPAKEPSAATADAPKSDVSAARAIPAKNTERALKSNFESEQVEIPAWLEPLARNASVHAPDAKETTNDAAAELKEWGAPAVAEPVSPKTQVLTTGKSVAAPRQALATPLFGNSLLGGSAPEITRGSGSGKGIWIGVAAGLLVAAASGAWYFRDSLGSLGRTSNSASQTNASTISSGVTASNASNSGESSPAGFAPSVTTEVSSAATKANPVNGKTETATSAGSSLSQGKMQAAAITERIPKPSSNVDAPAPSMETVEPEIKRPSLGAVRLAKPKVRRSPGTQASGETEPALELTNEALSEQNSLSTDFTEGSKQPAAPPLATGGDVTPARMISSVPPIYPGLARTQHVSGDVRIDALVDSTGRVTTMKVVSGPPLLHQAAMDALRQWRYQAASLNGKPVPMHLTVTIQFRLQ